MKGSPQERLKRVRSEVRRLCRGLPGFEGQEPVFGEGPVPAVVMIVGEAPGRDEAAQGRPFVGRAGRFFISELEDVFGTDREHFYITNVVKVWPHLPTRRLKTKPPTKEEAALFRPCLLKEAEAVSPRLIIAVGKTAFSALCPASVFTPGRTADGPGGVPVMPVYHPAYILRRRKAEPGAAGAMRAALVKARRIAERGAGSG